MASYKSQTFDLLSSVGGSYDQTRTTTQGTVAQRTVQSTSVLSPPANLWMDIQTDIGETITDINYTPNGRVFAMTAVTAGLARVVAYNFNSTTGVLSPIGRIQITLPNVAATTHTLRGFKVDDSNTSAIDIFVLTTGTVLINGGLFLVNNVPLSAFVISGFPTYTMGQGSNQTAVYFLQDPSNIGVNQLNTASAGLSIDRTNKIAYVHNGVSATHQYYLYDYSLTPNVPGTTVTITIATPGVVSHAGHSFNANDQITFTTTGALPTGLTAGTTYFVRNPVAGVSYEVSATSGGASINTTGAQSGVHTVYRAFGITSSLWKWKTGNLPALSGTLLLTNSENYVPNPGHTTNAGQPSIFFATTTNLYLGQAADLTNGAVTFPTLVSSNLLGTTNQIVAPTAVNAGWDDVNDKAFYTTNTSKIVFKQVVNNVISNIVGNVNTDYLEGVTTIGSSTLTQFGLAAIADVSAQAGWVMISGSTAGQRGILAKNSGADFSLDTSYFVTKAITFPELSNMYSARVVNLDASNSGSFKIYYRTSGFGSISGGWTLLPATGLFPANTYVSAIQYKVQFAMLESQANNPGFAIEVSTMYAPITQVSEYWVGSVDNSTQNGGSPAYTAFRMKVAYPSSVPTLYFRAVDDSGSVVASANTASNPTLFKYTTNNGTSWNALGTIPNTALTTEVRYEWASPPGVRVTCSLSES